jgi:hypothetical protein
VLERRRCARDQFLVQPAVAPPILAVDKVLTRQLADEHRTHRARRVGPQRDETTVMGGADLTGATWRPGDGNRWGGPRWLGWGPALRAGGEGCAATGGEGLDRFGHFAHREGGSATA